MANKKLLLQSAQVCLAQAVTAELSDLHMCAQVCRWANEGRNTYGRARTHTHTQISSASIQTVPSVKHWRDIFTFEFEKKTSLTASLLFRLLQTDIVTTESPRGHLCQMYSSQDHDVVISGSWDKWSPTPTVSVFSPLHVLHAVQCRRSVPRPFVNVLLTPCRRWRRGLVQCIYSPWSWWGSHYRWPLETVAGRIPTWRGWRQGSRYL